MSRKPTNIYRPVLDDLGILRAFMEVAECESFSEAGRRLNVVPSTISKHVMTLEERIGGQLILRSTKRLSVTELGQRFYERCQAIFHEVERAELEVSEYNWEPQGLLKIAVPPVLSTHHLAPLFSDFLSKHPKVQLDVSAAAETIDLIGGGIDVAVRISSNLDPGLIAIKLAPNTRAFCAAPSYLERHGTPETAADLVHHNCVQTRGRAHPIRWPTMLPDGTLEHIPVSGNFISNNGDTVRKVLLSGLGIGYVSRFLVHQDVVEGRLVELFPHARETTSHIYAAYVERRNMPLKTRAFLDAITSFFSSPPDWAR